MAIDAAAETPIAFVFVVMAVDDELDEAQVPSIQVSLLDRARARASTRIVVVKAVTGLDARSSLLCCSPAGILPLFCRQAWRRNTFIYISSHPYHLTYQYAHPALHI